MSGPECRASRAPPPLPFCSGIKSSLNGEGKTLERSITKHNRNWTIIVIIINSFLFVLNCCEYHPSVEFEERCCSGRLTIVLSTSSTRLGWYIERSNLCSFAGLRIAVDAMGLEEEPRNVFRKNIRRLIPEEFVAPNLNLIRGELPRGLQVD